MLSKKAEDFIAERKKQREEARAKMSPIERLADEVNHQLRWVRLSAEIWDEENAQDYPQEWFRGHEFAERSEYMSVAEERRLVARSTTLTELRVVQ
ncbi:hypothetical protein LCGC14_0823440 [marine sediment metagenome]|uniref:Uncharacterized protein n=1 Tax=marine sediment metagenome TaxID=412755 RepID=A0A0F9S2X3_9ZZZZ